MLWTKTNFTFFFFNQSEKKKETWYFGLLTWYDPAEIEHWSTEKCWALFILIHLAQRWQPLKVTQLHCLSNSWENILMNRWYSQ